MKITESKLRKIIREVIREGFAGPLSKTKQKKFETNRKRNSEVLGYKLSGKSDVKTSIGLTEAARVQFTIPESDKRQVNNVLKKLKYFLSIFLILFIFNFNELPISFIFSMYFDIFRSGYSKICASLRDFSIKLCFGFFEKEIHSETYGSNFSADNKFNITWFYLDIVVDFLTLLCLADPLRVFQT